MRLILDLDETLLDTLERQYLLLNDLLYIQKLSLEKSSYMRLKSRGLSNVEILLSIGAKRALANTIHAEYVRLIETEEYLKCDTLIVNYELLKRFSENNELHLCSMRSNPINSLAQLKHLNLESLFTSVSWVAHSEKANKIPAVAKIKETFGPIDYFIGDSHIDKEAAVENSISFILCDRGKVEKNPETIIQNLL
jgi:phosphoglycolate phosphatase-like HAD superfamily hydrolase